MLESPNSQSLTLKLLCMLQTFVFAKISTKGVMNKMIHLENVSKIYKTGNEQVKALDDVNIQIKEGELVIVRGPSGSGKSTLLFTIGGMLRPTEGKVLVDGKDIYSMNERERAIFRAENIGFVFQMFYLIPYLNVVENIILASGAGKNKTSPEKAKEMLKILQMSNREKHKPSELSTGEKQRAAIARASLNNPKIILADEPTGNLDPENAAEVMGYLKNFHNEGGTIIIVTHGKELFQHADRIINLRNGRIEIQSEE